MTRSITVFKNTKRTEDLPFSGERYIPKTLGNIGLEHLHRYATATELVARRRVLDLPCGEGYGSFMLSQFAKTVIGIDIDKDIVVHANDKYGSSIVF